MGKLMKTLDETGLSSNTVIAFIGDNGYMMGNRNLHGKVVPWEDSVRVPFIIWGPGVFKGKGTSQACVNSLDLPPTFMKLAGAEPPASWQGRDLTPVLADGKPHDITWSVSEFPDFQNWKFPGIAYRTVRTPTSKLIVWDKKVNKAPEFYLVDTDTEEQKNLYNDPAYKGEVDKLQGILDAWMKHTNDSWEMKGPLLKTEAPTKKNGKKRKRTDDD
jgi:arylsulfatase A-like enzyme